MKKIALAASILFSPVYCPAASFTFYPSSSVASGDIVASTIAVNQIVWADGTIQISSPSAGGSGTSVLSGLTVDVPLNMGSYRVNTSSSVNASVYEMNGGTVFSVGPASATIRIGLQQNYALTGDGNTITGFMAGKALGAGAYNTVYGYQALSKGGASNNTAIGTQAGSATTAINGTFVGTYSGMANTSGIQNTFIGQSSGAGNTTGSNNTAVGFQSGTNNGADNTTIGNLAGHSGTAYHRSVMVGAYSGNELRTGSQNTIVGYSAGQGVSAVSNFSSNTIVGSESGFSLLTNGGNNTFLGTKSGYSVTVGTGNILIGMLADTPTPGTSNYLNIGGVIKGDITPSAANLLFNSGVDISGKRWFSGYADGTWQTNKSGQTLSSGTVLSTWPTYTGLIAFSTAAVDDLAPIGTLFDTSCTADSLCRVCENGICPAKLVTGEACTTTNNFVRTSGVAGEASCDAAASTTQHLQEIGQIATFNANISGGTILIKAHRN